MTLREALAAYQAERAEIDAETYADLDAND